MHERVPAMSLAVGEQTGASRRASSGLHGAPVLYSTRTSCWRPWRRMVVRSSLRARLSAATGRLFCAWDGGLTIEEWIWPGTQATGPCHGARPWRTVCAEINDDRTEFKYIREDQGQISTASLVAMQTDTTVQSLDLWNAGATYPTPPRGCSYPWPLLWLAASAQTQDVVMTTFPRAPTSSSTAG